MDRDAIAVVEAAYRTEGNERSWLRGILEAARPDLDAGFGVLGFVFDAADLSAVRVSSPVVAFGPEGSEEVVDQIDAALQLDPEQQRALGILGPAETAEQLYARSHSVVSATEIMPSWSSTPAVRRWLHPFGIEDALVVKTVDLDRRGVLLAGPRGSITRPDARVAAKWGRVAAHLAAGQRVRGTMARAGVRTAIDGADAVISPDGRVVHAIGEARRNEGREALRTMALAIERARGPLRRRDEAEALSLWTALVAGRWTLLDHFDRDGRRWLVARRNDPQGRRALALGKREQQVAAFAAMGHSVKLIAYELGLSSSTVSEHLSSAMRKLGVDTRAELARLWADASDFGAPKPVHDALEDFCVAVAAPKPRANVLLTSAERAVVDGILRGDSNAAIARARGTSVRTVANQVARVFRKLGVGSRGELAAWAARVGSLPIGSSAAPNVAALAGA